MTNNLRIYLGTRELAIVDNSTKNGLEKAVPKKVNHEKVDQKSSHN